MLAAMDPGCEAELGRMPLSRRSALKAVAPPAPRDPGAQQGSSRRGAASRSSRSNGKSRSKTVRSGGNQDLTLPDPFLAFRQLRLGLLSWLSGRKRERGMLGSKVARSLTSHRHTGIRPSKTETRLRGLRLRPALCITSTRHKSGPRRSFS